MGEVSKALLAHVLVILRRTFIIRLTCSVCMRSRRISAESDERLAQAILNLAEGVSDALTGGELK